ncbi:ISAs1 family transposase [Kineococcus sp. LSe6-4]|uniref:ISAs1 family transposase n=1 Tax=Kineococcus halophytocola TaxID=3234027 RepID=A0ABV4H6V2_9ACTN
MPAAPSCPITLPADTPALDLKGALDPTSGLLATLAQVPDPRARRGVRHRFFTVLALAVMAVLTGARGYTAIWRWSVQALPETLHALDCHRSTIPSESTFRRTLQALDPDEFTLIVSTWLAAHLNRIEELHQHRQARLRAAETFINSPDTCGPKNSTVCVIAIDGKTVRGSRSANASDERSSTHLLAAFHTDTATVLGQQVVDAKTNEITHLPTLVTSMHERDLLPAGAVITADALHTQRESARTITNLGLHYAFTVKRNQPKLHDHLTALPWGKIPVAHSRTERGHGRIEERHTALATISDALGGLLDFPGARTAMRIVRRRRGLHQRPGQDSVEIVYAITSLPMAEFQPDVLAGLIRRHWAVENQLHYVRDTAFDEDRCRARTGQGATVLACLRNLAITALRLLGQRNIRAALEHHSYDRTRPLRTLQRLS